jgi:hypothetical protein
VNADSSHEGLNLRYCWFGGFFGGSRRRVRPEALMQKGRTDAELLNDQVIDRPNLTSDTVFGRE